MIAELAVRPAGVRICVAPESKAAMTTTKAVGRLTWALAHGEGLTVAQAAQLTGLTWNGAYCMLVRLSESGGIPIYDDHGVWQAVELRSLDL